MNVVFVTDGFVNANDILDIYSDYTEDHLFEVTSSGDFFMIRQCPQTGQLQIRRLTEVIGQLSRMLGHFLALLHSIVKVIKLITFP